ncbi:MAG TPA: alpha/beta hydrolase, partial [Alphaproteobacteria bacterium]|nr:alpha/beta hydrolase [Alphaproteobacteria bacterium]
MGGTGNDGKARHHSLAAPDGTSLAYARTPARRADLPGVVFCGGFRSDMTGTKARRLEAFCAAGGQAYVRFDYRGHGASGGAFADGTIGAWRDDALTVLDHATDGPQVIVGSSMGAWIAVLAALARPGRVAGLVTVAAAPDFTEDLVWARLDPDQRRTLVEDGVLLRPSAYSEDPYPFTRALIEE